MKVDLPDSPVPVEDHLKIRIHRQSEEKSRLIDSLITGNRVANYVNFEITIA
jgi:hypothetical protein